MNRAYIFHGWMGHSQENWLPWMKKELEKLGMEVFVPNFPEATKPELDNWLRILEDYKFDKETILIGHSLGNALILRFLERKIAPKRPLFGAKIRSAYLVAAFDDDLDIKELKESEFFDLPFDWEIIKKQSKKFYIINSDNDPYISSEYGPKIAWDLECEAKIMPKMGHFNKIKEFPYLLDLIKKSEC